jgi:NagD protein
LSKSRRSSGRAHRRLRSAAGFVFDLDGTLVLGNPRNQSLRPLAGARAVLELLRDRGLPFVVMTNGTAHTPGGYAAILRRAGLPVRMGGVLTPSSVAADHFAERGLRRVLVLGSASACRPLQSAGIRVVRPPESVPVDAVYIGWYRNFAFADLELACRTVERGAKLFAGSLAPFFASSAGPVLGASRAICAMISSLTGVRPTLLGKPSHAALRAASARLGVHAARLVVVGDDPAIEVRMAHAAGSLGIAVTTGVWNGRGRAALPHAHRPDLIFKNLAELRAALK